jgi:UDP-2-acetamido-3-amino-2,3-dideoxy-glucuronate N-acetyltransferase
MFHTIGGCGAAPEVPCLTIVTAVTAPEVRIHPTAIVESGALIGDGSSVWHHAHVRDGARVGSGCVLGKNVYVDTQAMIGDRCKIQNNVSVYHGVRIGNDVFVGPSATFTNDLVPRAFNADWKIVETTVRDGASIGANATIVCGVTLGEYSMVAAGATVTRDVADHQLVAGTPARHLGWVCRCGTVVSRDTVAPAELSCGTCS